MSPFTFTEYDSAGKKVAGSSVFSDIVDSTDRKSNITDR